MHSSSSFNIRDFNTLEFIPTLCWRPVGIFLSFWLPQSNVIKKLEFPFILTRHSVSLKLRSLCELCASKEEFDSHWKHPERQEN